jgi:catechol 2,3-dioxygenase-like lactoylglutathione lyase family enzyme
MIRGLGGVFIYAADAEALVAWYKQHLGLRFSFEPSERSYYVDFVLPVDAIYARTECEVFAIRQAEGAALRRPLVINWRVRELREVIDHLRPEGTDVDRTEDDYGRFASITDPDGNVLEFFEPL